MPTRNVNLTPQLNELVERKIRSGEFANASEVLRAGLRALVQQDREDRARVQAIRAALVAGEESGLAEDNVFAEVRTHLRKRASDARR